MRELKDQLYAQVAALGKAVSSPKRLELIELLCQSEKTVEELATQAGISVKLASAHLAALRRSRLVTTRKDGKYVFYRLADASVADFWVALRTQAEERLVELQLALDAIAGAAGAPEQQDRAAIMRKAAAGEVVVLDVRPAAEFAAAHLPHARSIPLAELRQRLGELPKGTPVVAYCRGPFCMFASDAAALLQRHGYHASHLSDGVAEWRARGLPLEA